MEPQTSDTRTRLKEHIATLLKIGMCWTVSQEDGHWWQIRYYLYNYTQIQPACSRISLGLNFRKKISS